MPAIIPTGSNTEYGGGMGGVGVLGGWGVGGVSEQVTESISISIPARPTNHAHSVFRFQTLRVITGKDKFHDEQTASSITPAGRSQSSAGLDDHSITHRSTGLTPRPFLLLQGSGESAFIAQPPSWRPHDSPLSPLSPLSPHLHSCLFISIDINS